MIPVSQLTYTYVYVLMYQHLLFFQLLILKYFCSSSYSSLFPCGIHFVQLRQLVYVTACGLGLSGCHQKSVNQNGTAVQKSVWKSAIESCCRVRHYVRDGCCQSYCCFEVLLDNILIIVSNTYLINVIFFKSIL